jgi:hypothetical protein
MKGVLNYQFKTGFIAALQKTYRDEQFISRFHRELADPELEIERHTLLRHIPQLNLGVSNIIGLACQAM